MEAGDGYADAGVTASDNVDGNITGDIATVNPVDANTVGAYTVTYDVTDSSENHAVQVTRTVNVVDTTASVISVPTDFTVQATSLAGALVNYAAAAIDFVGMTSFVCSSPSATNLASDSLW